MLVYEKIVDNVRQLFGTLQNTPAEDDTSLTYKNSTGREFIPELNAIYLDDKRGGIVRASDGEQVNVFIGDECIIGRNGAVMLTDIADKQFVAGASDPVEFTFSTIANDDVGTIVKGGSDFGVKYADALNTLEYYEVKDGKWYNLKGHEFGGDGFPLSDASSKFRASFNEDAAGEYTFTANITSVSDGNVICSVNVPFVVQE